MTGVVDKGAGRGALLYTEKRVIDAASGEVVAVANSTAFLRNDGGFAGYVGAAPPSGHGPHRYFIVVHAVDTEALDVSPDTTPAVLGFNLSFHTLARATLVATYEER